MNKIIRKTRKQKTTANAVVFIDLTIFNFSYNTVNAKNIAVAQGYHNEFQYRKR